MPDKTAKKRTNGSRYERLFVKDKVEVASFSENAVHAVFGVMGEEDTFDDAQTEAGPGHFPFMGFFTSVISVPDFFGFIFGDACTVIVNVHSYAVSFYTVKAQLYVFVVAGIIYGVADEVGEHLKDFSSSATTITSGSMSLRIS